MSVDVLGFPVSVGLRPMDDEDRAALPEAFKCWGGVSHFNIGLMLGDTKDGGAVHTVPTPWFLVCYGGGVWKVWQSMTCRATGSRHAVLAVFMRENAAVIVQAARDTLAAEERGELDDIDAATLH